eukprot:GEMP01046551.1.p1 GENE.GEMP01046551.1~~GEMP01046551.1.p1  ORF type:complete len:299 (-),score=43.75 GEMP01046551.1:841-1656(-)
MTQQRRTTTGRGTRAQAPQTCTERIPKKAPDSQRLCARSRSPKRLALQAGSTKLRKVRSGKRAAEPAIIVLAPPTVIHEEPLAILLSPRGRSPKRAKRSKISSSGTSKKLSRRSSTPLRSLDNDESVVCDTPHQSPLPGLVVHDDDSFFSPSPCSPVRNTRCQSPEYRYGLSPPRKSRREHFMAIFGPTMMPGAPRRPRRGRKNYDLLSCTSVLFPSHDARSPSPDTWRRQPSRFPSPPCMTSLEPRFDSPPHVSLRARRFETPPRVSPRF